jgi:hypothetical protein
MSTPKWLVVLQLIVLATLAGAVWADFTQHDGIWWACIAVFAVLAPLNMGVRVYRRWQSGQRQMSDTAANKLNNDRD